MSGSVKTNSLQLKKLAELLKQLYKSNNYYQNVLEKYDVNLENFSIDEFKKLPYLTKEDIRHNDEHYLSRTSEEIVLEMTTGTTGRPLKCPKSKSERLISSLYIWQERRSWDPEVNLNNFVSLYGNRFGDAFNFDIENMIRIYDLVMRTSPRWISAPITAIKQYAKLIEKYNLSSHNGIKYIELVGEYAEKEDRKYVEQVFGCKTIIHYGLRETWGIAYECPEGHLHVQDDLFIIQGISTRIDKQNVQELIITSLYNKLMPIIKYHTGDLGYIKYLNCKCGKEGQTVKLLCGRKAGIIKGPSEYLGDIFFKRVVSDMHYNGFDCIDGFVVTQTKIDMFDIHLVKKDSFTEDSAQMFHQLINNRLGREVQINLIILEQLPILPSGKSQLFKCLC